MLFMQDDLKEELLTVFQEVTEQVNKIKYLELLPEHLRSVPRIDLKGKTPNAVIKTFHDSLIKD